jgi:hypothetical protein
LSQSSSVTTAVKAPKLAKKGDTVTFTTASRWGGKSYKGTVIGFVKAGEAPPKVKDLVGPRGKTPESSNRDRYIVNVEGTPRFANASAVVAR